MSVGPVTDRHRPRGDGAVRVELLDTESTAPLARPFGEVGQAVAQADSPLTPWLGVRAASADPVIGDRDHQLALAAHDAHVDRRRRRVSHHVRQQLAHHRASDLDQLSRHGHVEQPGEPQARRESERRHDGVDLGGHRGPQAADRERRPAEVEDRRADVADHLVERVDRLRHAFRRQPAGQRERRFEAHGDREEPLDHDVVQLPSDPVVVGDAAEPLDLRPCVDQLERDGDARARDPLPPPRRPRRSRGHRRRGRPPRAGRSCRPAPGPPSTSPTMRPSPTIVASVTPRPGQHVVADRSVGTARGDRSSNPPDRDGLEQPTTLGTQAPIARARATGR